MSEVIIHDDENFERALKRFKKPSERRKRKLAAARRKNRRPPRYA
jgi:small subunit ribosomal protein S21